MNSHITETWPDRVQHLEYLASYCSICERNVGEDSTLIQGLDSEHATICENCVNESTDNKPKRTRRSKKHTHTNVCRFCLNPFDNLDNVTSGANLPICQSCLIICRKILRRSKRQKPLSLIARILFLESSFATEIGKTDDEFLFQRINHTEFCRAKRLNKFKAAWHNLFKESEIEDRLELLENIVAKQH